MRRITFFGTLLAAIVGLIGYAKEVFDWLGRIDFVVAHEADPGWVGVVMRPLIQLPTFLSEMPRWTPWLVLVAGLALIIWDSRRIANRNRDRVTIAAQTTAPERDKHSRISKWLVGKCVDRKLQVRRAALFGSVVHDHYPTSDVDLIVLFNPCSNRQLAKLVKRIKGDVAREFHATFGHSLHVTFFCSHEQRAMTSFIDAAGKHEIIIED